jgi:uncharacterized protein
MDIDATIAEVAKRTPGIISAYLFGSFAEGRHHRESDLDVGVLLDRAVYPTSNEWFDVRVLLTGELSGPGRPDADVVILNDAPPQLGRAIITRGRRVYCTDPAADHAYVRDVQLLAADIDPWMQRMWQLKLKALER